MEAVGVEGSTLCLLALNSWFLSQVQLEPFWFWPFFMVAAGEDDRHESQKKKQIQAGSVVVV